MKKLDKTWHQKLDTIVKSMGCEFVGGELVGQGGRAILRIYIDKPNGVTVDDCSNVSRQLSAMLAVEGAAEGQLNLGQYNLEVSSPGIDRPLFMPEQYEKYVGQVIRLRLHLPVSNRRQYQGVLLRVEKEHIHLQVDGVEQAVEVPFSVIDKANLVAEIGFKKTK